MQWSFFVGFNTTFWSAIGGLRYLSEKFENSWQKAPTPRKSNKKTNDVAVCIAAHNEAKVISATIKSLVKNLPARHIYVASDNSSDNTVRLARKLGCRVLQILSGVGKPRALEQLISHYGLLKKYRYIIFADADTVFTPHYIKNALPLFKDPEVAAVAGFARSDWPRHAPISFGDFIIGYRTRQYLALQWMLTYGQTWRLTNVSSVIPGFASMYRTDILKMLHIYTPGVVIEDFSLLFQIRKLSLGKIAHHPSVYATTQDPDNIDDYSRQMDRWNLGFWQTVRHWNFWPSWFWVALIAFVAELTWFSIVMVTAPAWIMALAISRAHIPNYMLLIAVVYLLIFIMDYIVTIIVAIADRRPKLLLYGLGFTVMRIIDAVTFINSIPRAFLTRSNGRWISPGRRTAPEAPS